MKIGCYLLSKWTQERLALAKCIKVNKLSKGSRVTGCLGINGFAKASSCQVRADKAEHRVGMTINGIVLSDQETLSGNFQ